jgi:hypothetical protein
VVEQLALFSLFDQANGLVVEQLALFSLFDQPATLSQRRRNHRSGYHDQVPARRRGIQPGHQDYYMRATTRQRPEHHGQVSGTHNERRRVHRPVHHEQVPATHSERRCGQRPGPMPMLADVPIHHKRPTFVFFLRAFVANKQNSPAEIRGVGAKCVCVGGGRACSLCS